MRAAFAMRGALFGEIFPDDLRVRLAELVDVPGTVLSGLRGTLGDVEVLITGWGCPRVDAAVLDGAPRLRAIVHAAGSVKGHLTPEVFERGIVVSSAADANAAPVADYTMSMLVLAAKSVPRRIHAYATGGWPAGPYPGVPNAGEAAGLGGATVGVIGASRIGRLVIERLTSYRVTPLLTDPYVNAHQARELGCELVELDNLCRRANLVTIHAPALPETYQILDKRRLGLLPDGATLINTARGTLVDTDALTRECASGRLNAILDVTDPEPLPAGHPLLAAPGVWVTPHISGARGRELRALGEYAVGEIERFITGQPLRGQVRSADLLRIA
ncbi:hydroxyacid dehydrogenase [Nonomuraea rubra]|uniref:Phosphoglycerate dehydrogenase-like enzyme n=1 Tax=Nonomuraea rubra TaxID=46180 RepID=A0A7X0P159_9ACTN|nr:hydroxyacid dehydrogenase [Nonomuraea rubra]MBB6553376.1 phosphoglycerate dehydrogenase-like enzyme [Nonomuraea rubra]